MNYIQKMIQDICKEENIQFHLVSKDWIMVLEKNLKRHFIVGYKFELNDHAAGLICDDKYALFDVLKLHDLPVCEHYIFFKNYDREEVKDYFLKCNRHVVLKINDGTCGMGVYSITDLEPLYERMDSLFLKHYSVSISPFYEIKNEYRTILLDGEVELFYGKKRPIVVGDGVHTIYQLLCEFNPNYFLKLEEHSELDKVLVKEEVFEYGWKHNLSKGSVPFLVADKKLEKKIQRIASEVMNYLSLRFASVDIIELENGELLVLEVNSGVMMENYAQIMNAEDTCREIYRKAILKMFDEK